MLVVEAFKGEIMALGIFNLKNPGCKLYRCHTQASHHFSCKCVQMFPALCIVFSSPALFIHLSTRLSVCLLPPPRPSPLPAPLWFYKLYRVQTVEGADTVSGREEERRQDRSSLHHSSAEKRRDVDVKEGTERERDKERARDCTGRGERGKEKEWATTQHSHQLPSIHHLSQPKGCHCFISITSLHITCTFPCTCTYTGRFRIIYLWKCVQDWLCGEASCVYVCLSVST